MLALCLFTLLVLGNAAHAKGEPVVPILFKAADTRPGEHMAVADVVIGKPPRKLRLELRFDVADILLIGDQKIHSDKFTYDRPLSYGSLGYDSVFFGSEERRTRVVSDTRGRTPPLTYPLLCSSCVGIMGLRSDAMAWKWWPTASMTTVAITFGKRIPVLEDASSVFNCALALESDASVCTIQSEVHGVIVQTAVDPASPYITVPEHVRSAYLSGKNIYQHDRLSEWNTLRVQLISNSESENISLGLTHDDLVGQHGSQARELLIRTGEQNDTMIIGNSLLWKYALYIDKTSGTMTLHQHAVWEHLPTSYVILFLLGTGILLRYKMVSTVRHYDSLPRDTAINFVSLLYEIAGFTIPIVLLILPETRNVLLPDFTELYIVTAVIVGVGILTGIAARVRVSQGQRNQEAVITPFMFCVMFAEAMFFETVVLIGLWLAVVPRRREGIASVLTVFVGACALYTAMTYFFYWATFVLCRFGQTRKSKTRITAAPVWLSGLISLATVGVLAYFAILLVFFFLTPLIERVGTIYADLALGASLVGASIIVMGGTYVAAARVKRAIGIHIRARLKTAAGEA